MGLSQQDKTLAESPGADPEECRVRGVRILHLPHFEDARGHLSVGEIHPWIPFTVRRFFLVYGVSSEEVRGEHAHRTLHQVLVCAHGCIKLIADDGINRQEFILNSPNRAVYLPPMIWGVQHGYSHDGVLLVLASERYDPGDYIRDYSEFRTLCSQEQSG